MITVNNAEEIKRKDEYIKKKQKTDLFNQLLRRSDKITFFFGESVSSDTGTPDLFGVSEADGAEDGFGQSGFALSKDAFNDNRNLFISYFCKRIEKIRDLKPGVVHNTVFSLINGGKDISIITRGTDGLFIQGKDKMKTEAQKQKVYELYGSIYNYYCMNCGQDHNINYFLSGKPEESVCIRCETDKSQRYFLKPGITLYGERLDCETLGKAIDAVKRSDLLVIAGADPAAYPNRNILRYFEDGYSVLINEKKRNRPNHCDIVFSEKPEDIFSLIDTEYCTGKSDIYCSKLPPFELKYFKV